MMTHSDRGSSGSHPIYVIDRHGREQPVRFDLVTERNEVLCAGGKDGECGPPIAIDCPALTAEVVRRFASGMTTRQLDFETAALAIQHAARDPSYDSLAVRLMVSDMRKRIPVDLAALVAALAAAAPTPRALRFSPEYLGVVARGAARIAARLRPSRDNRLRYFGLQTLVRSYLIRAAGPAAGGKESSLLDERLAECPAHLFMRVALGIFACQPGGRGHEAPEAEFAARLEEAFAFYDRLSLQEVSNASPTFINAGTQTQQLSSCFQLAVGDELGDIFDSLKAAAMVSKAAGGVSIWLHAVRAEGAPIHRTGGRASGTKHVLRLLNDTQQYVDQGGNRPGAFAVYLAPDHADVFTFLALARRKGEEALRGVSAPDLKYALWIPDMFMEALRAQIAAAERAEAGAPPEPGDAAAGDWHLFSPDSAPGLHLVYGDAYRELYDRYVAEGRAVRRVKAGDIIAEAFRTWAQVGVPYVLYKDHINRKSNMQNVAPICSSNLCCAGDTFVLTDMGQVPISLLKDLSVEVWNGSEWSDVIVRQTNEAAELVRVTLDNGVHLDCTPYHKFYVVHGSKTASHEVRAAALQPGDRLEKSPDWPVVHEGDRLAHAYTSGFFAADGHHTRGHLRCGNRATNGDTCVHHRGRELAWPCDGQCRAWRGHNVANLYGAKKDLLPYLDVHPDGGRSYEREDLDRRTVYLVDDLLPKSEAPLGADLPSRLEWLAGLSDGDGSVAKNGTNLGLQLTSINLDFLRGVRLLLQTLGCDPKIGVVNEAGERVIRGQTHPIQKCYRIVVTSWDLGRLLSLGFTPHRLDFGGFVQPNRDARHFVRVVSVEPLPGRHPTYCFEEPLRHRGVFNGILTGQCCEITIPSWSNCDTPEFARFHPGNEGGEFGVCNLGAVCLEAFVREGDLPGHAWIDWAELAAAAALEVRALNKIIDLNDTPCAEGRRSNLRHRPVGLGVMGLADVLARLRQPYGSPEALRTARALAAVVYFGALDASALLAAEEGAYQTFRGSPLDAGRLQPDLWTEQGHYAPLGAAAGAGWQEDVAVLTAGFLAPERWDDLRARIRRTGVRNAYLLAFMPTATTSNIVGQNESFEPFTSNLYTRHTLAGEFTIINRHLVRSLQDLGLWDDMTRRELLAAGGSVQGLARVPEDVKKLFRTARELHPSLLVRTAAAMAPFVCQSMSLNLYLDEPDLPKILRFMFEGWEAGLKTGIYYTHTRPAAGSQQTSTRHTVAVTADPPSPSPAARAPAAACRRDDPGCTSCSL